MNFDLSQLDTLRAVLRTGSFDAAAQELAVTQSAVSQRIKLLEAHVGAQLIHRERPCTGTEIGLRLASHAEQVALLENRMLAELNHQTKGTDSRIHLATNADSLATWLLEALADVPQDRFALSVDDQDYSLEWLRRGKVIAAVTASQEAAPGCDVVPLGTLNYVATASPAFLQQYFPDGVTADALSLAPILRFNAKDRLQQNWIRQQFEISLFPPTSDLPSSEGFVSACKLGLGWGVNPLSLVADDLAAGRLVALADGAQIRVPLYWQVTRLMAPALTNLTKAVKAAAKRHLQAAD